MFGVVLWSDEEDGKAVFWCEDQGDLAYYEGGKPAWGNKAAFDAGDMVQFDVVTEFRLRRAKNPLLVQEKACKDLPAHLRKGASESAGSAKVLPFVRPETQSGKKSVQKAKLKG